MAKTNRVPSSSSVEMNAKDSAFREKLERANRPVRTAAPSTTTAPTMERAPKAPTLGTMTRFVAKAAPSIAHAPSACETRTSAAQVCEQGAPKEHARSCGRGIAPLAEQKARGSRAAPVVALGISRGDMRGHARALGRAALRGAWRGVREGPRARAPTRWKGCAPSSTTAPSVLHSPLCYPACFEGVCLARNAPDALCNGMRSRIVGRATHRHR